MKKIDLYIKGVCSTVSDQGAWAFFIEFDQRLPLVNSGKCKHTTSEIMDITALVKALNSIKLPSKIIIHTDSNYIMRRCKFKWIRNIWLHFKKTENKNCRLWCTLENLLKKRKIKFKKIKKNSTDSHIKFCYRSAIQKIEKKIN